MVVAVAVLMSACAAPLQRPATTASPSPSGVGDQRPVRRDTPLGRPSIGVAFGGGSARGIAHVGVIGWLEEHCIPIDLAAGTSMGGLIGGAFAAGMDAADLDRMLASIDWDDMFGSSTFPFRNIRRKSDARAYPSRLEFGVKGGLVPPTSLDRGGQVELLMGRITAPYFDVGHFDNLPTPFRAVAVDLVRAEQVVLDHGSLAQVMRATMSLPLIFPPVELDGRLLVDGGAMNNVPADVVKAMGADRVIAVNVGDLADPEGIASTLTGLAGATIDAMMRSSTKAAMAAADVVINVPLKEYGSLDWRRSAALIQEGYKAAEAARDTLLPLAVSEDEYARWQRDRDSRRRSLPIPVFTAMEGVTGDDARRLKAELARHEGVPLEIAALERDLARLSGHDRYETVTWRLVRNESGEPGLVVVARPKPYAPPFVMLGVNLENTTSSDFRITLTGRYLAYDVIASGSELRIDGTIGSNPGAGVEFYQPIPSTPLFVAPYAAVATETFNAIADDELVARYDETRTRGGINVGVNIGSTSDLRVGAYIGRLDANVAVGDPGLPEMAGAETAVEATWRIDSQDSPVVPAGGTLSSVHLFQLIDAPDVVVNGETVFGAPLTQLSAVITKFWSAGDKNRLFVHGGLATSFHDTPLRPNQFTVGGPFRLGAYRPGELLGNHAYVASGGYMRQWGRLPDFMGGPIFAGAWLENGDAFDDWTQGRWRTNASGGVIMDTIIGPVLVAGSAGFDGRWRTYIGIGRIFR
jgi:NTE family protein